MSVYNYIVLIQIILIKLIRQFIHEYINLDLHNDLQVACFQNSHF